MKHRMTLLMGALVALSSTQVQASSHREAPNVTRLPTIDSTDFYAFRSYEAGREGYVTLIANYIPLQDAYGGPNYFAMDPNALYEIHIDNDGDAVEDITFQFRFQQALGGSDGSGTKLNIDDKQVAIPLKNFGGVDAETPAVNFYETYTVTKVMGDRRSGMGMALTGDKGETFAKPLDYIGDKSFADYVTYADGFVHTANIPGCDAGKVFVGQRKDPFVVNLGKTFDLVNYTPIESDDNPASPLNDDLADKNVTSIALEVPINCLITDADNPVIGAWTSASLPQGRILNSAATFENPELNGGAWTQVSRLGMPLVNEVVIGLPDKDRFSSSEPKDDGQFADYVTHPTLPALLDILFRDAVGASDNIAPSNIPRNDLVTAFLTGFPGVNQVPNRDNADAVPSEMLRLNTAIDPTPNNDETKQKNFGVVVGDLAGFPNGRRPGDDVVDIALRVVMGALCHPVNLDSEEEANDDLGLCTTEQAPTGNLAYSDLAPLNADSVDSVFPYLKTPLAGAVSSVE